MSKMKLRTRIPMSYYEPEDPSFDEYIYCDYCRDFVYEYCSLHGPLLVIPDTEVSCKDNHPSSVPLAALTIPSEFLHIAPSIIPGAGLGVFATLTLPRGVRFGPFCGRQARQISTQYCWMIQDANMRYKHVIDASDANASNWMRYVNCARHWHEQNLVAYQYRGQIYYRTIKIIPRFTELMVFYGSQFAMNLNVDLRNYNSEYFCQKVAPTSLNKAPIHEELHVQVHNIENPNYEETHIEMSFEEDNSIMDGDLTTTAMENFVIIDSYDDIKTNKEQQNYMNPKDNIPETSHTKNDLTCDICQKTYVTRYNLKRHKIVMHTVRTDEANDNTKVTNKDSFELKLQLLPTNKNCLTSNSDQLILNKNDLKCDICHRSFSSRYNLKRHINEMHVNKNQLNILINDSSNSKQKINDQNINTDMNDGKFENDGINGKTCYICQKSFTRRSNLKVHLDTHDTITYKCNLCDKTLISRKSFNQHKLNHSTKPTKCTICSYTTYNMEDYKAHVKSHLSGTIYKCDMCSYYGTKRSYILRHLRKHHNFIFKI